MAKGVGDLSVQFKQLLNVNQQILDQLDTLVKVTAIQVGQELSVTERARMLKLAGMDNQTIAEVLNTSPETIFMLTANLRKAKTRRSKKAGGS